MMSHRCNAIPKSDAVKRNPATPASLTPTTYFPSIEMCSSSAMPHRLRFSAPPSAPHSTRLQLPPHSVSFRSRPSPPPLRAALNDAAVAGICFYDLLGIPATGSSLEIKRAYKQLVRKYHPDVSPPGLLEEYTLRFIQVQEAYETLSDPSLRELYDRQLANGLHLAFRRSRLDEEMEDRIEWKNRWRSQLSGLKMRSEHKEAADNMSWGARMRRERNEAS